jgi:CubicO group peptidase (beta-lactamase class C family)
MARFTAAQQQWAKAQREIVRSSRLNYASINEPKWTKGGGSLWIEVDGAPLLTECWGTADEATMKPYTFDTINAMWSQSKDYTGAVIAKAVERGQVNWDDKLSDFALWRDNGSGVASNDYYDPEQTGLKTPVDDNITIRMLCSHTSGMDPGYDFSDTQTPDGIVRANANIQTAAEWVTYYASRCCVSDAYANNNYPETYGAHYRDKAIGLALVLIADKIGSHPWDMLQEMFDAMGMVDSYPALRYPDGNLAGYPAATHLTGYMGGRCPATTPEELSTPYYGINSGELIEGITPTLVKVCPEYPLGAAGCFSSARDLAKFAIKYTTPGAWLKKETIDYITNAEANGDRTIRASNYGYIYKNQAVHAEAWDVSPPFIGWGLGLYIHRPALGYNGTDYLTVGGQGGGGGGWTTWFLCVPELKITASYSTNCTVPMDPDNTGSGVAYSPLTVNALPTAALESYVLANYP